MDYDKFQSWCSEREKHLKKYFLGNWLAPSLFLLFIALWYWIGSSFDKFLNENNWLWVLYFFVFGSVWWIGTKIFEIPMNNLEITVCLLNKIAKDMELCRSEKDKKALFQDLKNLKNHFKNNFPVRVITRLALFKKENEKQITFFKLLKSLPDRLFYCIKSDKEANIDDIKKLSFYLLTDHEEKIELLNRIIEDNPDVERAEPKIDFKKIYANNLFKIFITILLLSLIFYFVVYKFLGINKDSTFLGFIAIVGTVIVWFSRKK